MATVSQEIERKDKLDNPAADARPGCRYLVDSGAKEGVWAGTYRSLRTHFCFSETSGITLISEPLCSGFLLLRVKSLTPSW